MARTALAALGTSIFSEMTKLANERGAVNLSQGFPDFEGPDDVKEAAIAALREGHNQYGRSQGVPPLVQAIAAHQKRCYGIELDPMTQVCATAGATEAIAAAFIGLLDAGDEVVLFEPFYDEYPAAAAMAGATTRILTLKFPAFALDIAALENAIVPGKSRMIVVNTPHNPSGHVFTESELDAIARVCIKHDLIALTDEVYEHITYDGARHVPLSTREGMRERTVAISSTGKTFSYTGWKVGWATGPAELVAAVQRAHQFLTFAAATPLHHAMARALDAHQAPFFAELQREYTQRRDFLVDVLRDVGFEVSVPKGAYFAVVSTRALTKEDDVTFARRLIDEAGVAAIPPSAFYARDVDEGRSLLRFAFCKKRETLERAAERLRAWKRTRAA